METISIEWGGITFDGPDPITQWDPPYRAAVYAIMMRPDPENKPTTYRILYFGESSNLSERGFYRFHHKYECWLNEAGSESNLFIGIYLMPNSIAEERKRVEQRLVSEYNPKCND